MENSKTPPHSTDAEQAVLGAILKNNEVFEQIADAITEADFYHRDHQAIFAEIARLVGHNREVDVVILAQELKDKKIELQNPTQDYLEDLVGFAEAAAANVTSYAKMIRDRAILRALSQTGAEIARDAFEPQGRLAEDLLNDAERKILAIADSTIAHREGFVPIRPILRELLQQLNDLAARDNPTGLIGLSTGFIDLDQKTLGLQKGDLIIVAGRPSMGKTAFALNIAEHVALREKKSVAIFSVEMGAEQLGMRILSSYSNISATNLRAGRLDDVQWATLSQAASDFLDNKIFIDGTGGSLNPIVMRNRARRLKREHPDLALIIVDYIQLMTGSRQTDNRVTEVSEISRSIKALARELNIPIIALSQLSRKVEERSDKRPVMSDLRESGAIEQDADLILLLFREEYYKPDDQSLHGLAELIIGKNRNGPTGKVDLSFAGEFMRFRNHAKDPNGF